MARDDTGIPLSNTEHARPGLFDDREFGTRPNSLTPNQSLMRLMYE